MGKKAFNINNISLLLAVLLIAFFVFTPIAFAEPLSETDGLGRATKGLEEAAIKGFGDSTPNDGQGLMSDIPSSIGKIIGAGLAFVGVLFFGLMIYGGLLWMMARGNESEVQKAKDLITAAVIGLVIVLAAYALTSFIAGQLGAG